jgi:hypothetical protein
MSEPHDVVKLLLARMESHPKEFAGITITREQDRLYTSRWGALINQFWYTLTTEEQTAINDKLLIVNRHHFHSEVMRELLDPKESRAGKQMELFPAQTAYPPGGGGVTMPNKVLTAANVTQTALKILEDEIDRNLQKQRGR